MAYNGTQMARAELNYGSTKAELSAALKWIQKYKYYLGHKHFILRLDNKALTHVHTMEPPVGCTQRWLETLANYDFTVVHRAGKQHGNADSLSRAPHLPPPDEQEDQGYEESLAAVLPANEHQNHRPNESTDPVIDAPADFWSVPEWVQKCQKDPDLAILYTWLQRGTPPSKTEKQEASPLLQIYAGHFLSMYIDKNGLIRIKRRGAQGKDYAPALVPKDWQQVSLLKLHKLFGHKGLTDCLIRAQALIWFPNMLPIAQDAISSCLDCQKCNRKPQPQKHTLVSPQTGYPWQGIAVDYVGPINTSNPHKYILTCRDRFTRYLEAFPVREADAKTVIKILTTQIIPRYGVPASIKSDRGTPFMAGVTHEVARTLGIAMEPTPAYNPKSNPVERDHQDLMKIIKKLSYEQPSKWTDHLPHALYVIRTSVNRMTGASPYQLLFGREAVSDLDLMFGDPNDNPNMKPADYAAWLKRSIAKAHEYARTNMAKEINRRRQAYFHRKVVFQPGQLVWLFTPTVKPGLAAKLQTYWTGPWTVLKQINDVTYAIGPDPTWTRKDTQLVSIDRLKIYKPEIEDPERPGIQPPTNVDLGMPFDEAAENITNNEYIDTDSDQDDDVDDPMEQPRPDQGGRDYDREGEDRRQELIEPRLPQAQPNVPIPLPPPAIPLPPPRQPSPPPATARPPPRRVHFPLLPQQLQQQMTTPVKQRSPRGRGHTPPRTHHDSPDVVVLPQPTTAQQTRPQQARPQQTRPQQARQQPAKPRPRSRELRDLMETQQMLAGREHSQLQQRLEQSGRAATRSNIRQERAKTQETALGAPNRHARPAEREPGTRDEALGVSRQTTGASAASSRDSSEN